MSRFRVDRLSESATVDCSIGNHQTSLTISEFELSYVMANLLRVASPIRGANMLKVGNLDSASSMNFSSIKTIRHLKEANK